MTSLRKRFFPARVNRLDAHVAVVRALPGSEMVGVLKDLTCLTSSTPAFSVRKRETFRLSEGVAVNIDDGGHSQEIYEALRKNWYKFLSRQNQSYESHYTVAGKLEDEQDVQDCLVVVHKYFQGSEGSVEGLALDRYNRGW
jgi:hypothetical protein